MEEGVKGTVTSLSSIFPVEDAQKAAKRVQDSITDQQNELDRVQGFIADNTNLINLVQKLPDELSHQIMVPFGKAAFFPGRLIHTNEFLVLLGEGYYAERTAKQTNEILNRRGKILESQAESLKAMISDLKAEASFFYATASEAAEGIVEIREDYIEEDSAGTMSKSGLQKLKSLETSEVENAEGPIDDEEYALIMSRMDELEKQENASEQLMVTPSSSLQLSKNNNTSAKGSVNENQSQQGFPSQSTFEDVEGQRMTKDESSHGMSVAYSATNYRSVENALSVSKEKTQPSSSSGIGGSKDVIRGRAPTVTADYQKVSEEDGADHALKMGTNANQAFTGSIVERTHGIQTRREQTTPPSQSTVSHPSKPVSRFKMQKGSRQY